MARPRTEAADYKKIVLRVPTALLEICKTRAEETHRSLNAQLVWAIETGMHFREQLVTEDATKT